MLRLRWICQNPFLISFFIHVAECAFISWSVIFNMFQLPLFICFIGWCIPAAGFGYILYGPYFIYQTSFPLSVLKYHFFNITCCGTIVFFVWHCIYSFIRVPSWRIPSSIGWALFFGGERCWWPCALNGCQHETANKGHLGKTDAKLAFKIRQLNKRSNDIVDLAFKMS